jgi:hypothetical protein
MVNNKNMAALTNATGPVKKRRWLFMHIVLFLSDVEKG